MDRNLGFSEENANRQAIIGVCSLLQILPLGEIALLKLTFGFESYVRRISVLG
jgi:hypothetical protein